MHIDYYEFKQKNGNQTVRVIGAYQRGVAVGSPYDDDIHIGQALVAVYFKGPEGGVITFPPYVLVLEPRGLNWEIPQDLTMYHAAEPDESWTKYVIR